MDSALVQASLLLVKTRDVCQLVFDEVDEPWRMLTDIDVRRMGTGEKLSSSDIPGMGVPGRGSEGEGSTEAPWGFEPSHQHGARGPPESAV